MSALVDQWGKPLQKELLKRDVAGPTLAGVRQPVTGYPGDGLTPVRLANLLREADAGEPLRYFELAEQIEERDLHYAGVLGTRKRSVSQIEVTVEAASDDPEAVRRAELVREWLKRDELADETFDMLDAIGKGLSFTEIVWDTSEGQWRPGRLEWRDPRWFRPDRDGTTMLLRGGIDGQGADAPLPAFKFIQMRIKAKSGLPVRSGLARLAAWSWMFKAYTQRDWAIFTQTYGQPIRVGRYHPGATEQDKETLYTAVANIAGDCAAIIPQGMEIEFVSADNLGTGAALYRERSDWLDRQVSKAVLGQTNTTDALAGGLGSGQAEVHNDVREDIEKADCKALSAALNRDLVRPWMDLEFGAPASRGAALYPRIVIARPDKDDLNQLSTSLARLVPLGLKVSQAEIRDKFGLNEPDDDEEVLEAAPLRPTAPLLETGRPTAPVPDRPTVPLLEAGEAGMPEPAEEEEAVHAAERSPPHPADAIAHKLADEAAPLVEEMASAIEAMLANAGSMGEFREMLHSAFPAIDTTALAALLADGMAAANAAGASDAEDESA